VAEVTQIAGVPIAPTGVHAAHPAFDVTPATLITALITERGVIHSPDEYQLQRLFDTA
jgi:methylthioribose-1-phosphate isomerase